MTGSKPLRASRKGRRAPVVDAQLESGVDAELEAASPPTVEAPVDVKLEAGSPPPLVAASPPVAVVVPLAVLEVGRLLPAHLVGLPRPTSLDLEMIAAPKVPAISWSVTTSATRYRELRESDRPVLLASEFCALAVAAEHGRASAVWLADRLSHRRAQIDLGVALGGAPHRAVDDDRPDWLAPRGRGLWGVIEADFAKRAATLSSGGWHLEAWPIARVLHVWGVRIVRVGIGEAVEWFE
jgi:hypothetical protein